MHYSEFAELYSRQTMSHESNIPLQSDPVLDLVEAKAVATGIALQTYLTSDTPDVHQVARAGSIYAANSSQNRNSLLSKISSVALKDTSHDPIHNAIGGHLISATFWPYLGGLGTQTAENALQQTINFYRTQANLAALGLHIAEKRSELAQSTFKTPNMPYRLFAAPYRAYDRCSKGLGNEIDAALLLLEFVRKNSGTILLPTPPQYERGRVNGSQDHSNLNSDYLLLRPESKRIIGIQIKSQVNPDTVQKYHESVVMISGRDDMDNIKAMRTRPDSSTVETVMWPGYMALHKLKHMFKSKELMRTLNPTDRIQLITLIRKTQQTHSDTKPNFQTAYSHIQTRLKKALEIPEVYQSAVTTAPTRRSGKNRRK